MNNGTRLRILFTADHLKFGGAERHLVAVASGLNHLGHSVSIAYMKDHTELADELHSKGVTSLHCCESRGGVDISAIRRLARLIKIQSPDVLVATSQYSLALTTVARMLCRKRMPILFISHSMEHVIRGTKDKFRFQIYRRFYRLANHVVFVSDLQRTFFKKLGVTPVSDEVIYNGVDLSRFSIDAIASSAVVLRSRLGFLESDLVVGVCAVFREEKRQIDLLDAIRLLRDQGLQCKVLLVGDGTMRHQIEEKIVQLGLQKDVVLSGFQSDVRPFVALCDIMALTSHAETFPIATLEYMALSKPLVSSDVGGISEQVISGQNGLLYPAGNIEALAEAIRKLEDRSDRVAMGLAGRRIVEERFSQHEMINRFSRTLLRLCSNHNG